MFKKVVIGIAIFSGVFAFLVFSCKLPFGCESSNTKTVGALTMWGTLPAEKVTDTLNRFNSAAKTYSITYQEIPEDKFEGVLVSALANGEGPDLIFADYKTILSQRERISAFPFTSFPVNDFKNSYIDGASIFLTNDGILAFPITVEPLMMFVNRDIISKNGVPTTPLYWDEVLSVVPQLTKKDADGRLLSYGIGLGSMTNVVHAKEIIISLILSLGQVPVNVDASGYLHFTGNNPASEESVVLPLRESLKLFTQFSDPSKETYSWNSFTGMTDKDAFAAGKLAFYIGYSGEYKEIAEKNERLNFYLSQLPQPRGYDSRANSMQMHAIAVMKRTPQNLKMTAYTAQSTLATSLYANSIGQATSKLSPIRSVLAQDQNLDSGLKSSILVTKGWYDLQKEYSTMYLTTAVDDIVSGKKSGSQAAQDFVNMINERYAK